MANWNSQKIYSGFNAEQYVDQHIAGREGGREGINTSKRSDYDVVGINVHKIPTVQSAITLYINKIKSQIERLDPLATSGSAYRSTDSADGDVEIAVREYINKVKTYCMNLTSQLEAFNDKLEDVKAAWDQGAKSIADSVNTSNSAFSEGTQYTRQF